MRERTNDPEIDVGSKIRELRKRKNLSLTRLSELTGIAASNLSSLELNKSSPTLNTLVRIADAFNMKVSEFLDEVVYEKVVLRRRGQGTSLETASPGHSVTVLFGDEPHHMLESRLIALVPESREFAVVPSETDRYLFCFEGTVAVRVGGVEYGLDAGDSMYLLGGQGFSLRSNEHEEATVLLVSLAEQRRGVSPG
jgi:transcriptional regulator with XRE-family HTH domain